jgi:hypothetical protein
MRLHMLHRISKPCMDALTKANTRLTQAFYLRFRIGGDRVGETVSRDFLNTATHFKHGDGVAQFCTGKLVMPMQRLEHHSGEGTQKTKCVTCLAT